ncbi:hypothetical protein [Kiloniella antarctica]|uniref:Uncharacterized protein n=1 Tax=Kiloniella antarctica TaxID=1550907 RepID=A0ABW5BN03_9PROT
MRNVILSFLLLTGLAACQTTGLNSGDVGFKQGDIIEGNFKFGFNNLVVPLPEGPWEVASIHTDRNNQNDVGIFMFLVQGKNGRVAQTLELTTNQYPNRWGYATSSDCKRDGIHFRETFANFEGRNQDCMWLNHYRGEITSTSWYGKYLKSAVNYAKGKGYEWPLAVLASGHRLARVKQFFNYELAINPQSYGFPEPVNVEWKTSDWHPNSTAKDADKTAFIDKLKKLTISYHETVKAGWEGKLVVGEVESFSNSDLELGAAQ